MPYASAPLSDHDSEHQPSSSDPDAGADSLPDADSTRPVSQQAQDEAVLVERAVALASELVASADATRRRADRRRRARLGRLLDDPAAKAFTIELTDAVLRVDEPQRAAQLFTDVVARHGIPAAFGPLDRLALRIGATLARRLPTIVMPLVRARVRKESAGVVLAAEERPFARHLADRRRDGIRLNLNVLGEAILGEEEAVRRLDAVIERLSRPDVDYVSVKVSAVASQLNPLAFDATVERLVERLRPLYATAARFSPAKFVNLDMEEYRDLELTVAVFRRLLDEPAFERLEAGIVLQAYLPDSVAALHELTAWATARHARTGAGIKVRLVKGANLAMEQVEAELHGWTAAPYDTKADVDANYKRLVDWALRPEHACAVRVGIASHNLFDVAWAMTLADHRGVGSRVELEMLEGMADAEAREAGAQAARRGMPGVLLYTPVTGRADFTNAIAYLVRRLDENTAPENYLRAAFSMTPGSAAFAEQADRFRAAVARRDLVSSGSRRGAARQIADVDQGVGHHRAFENAPDLDLAVGAVRDSVERSLASWHTKVIPTIPLVVDGRNVMNESRFAVGIDPSEPADERYRYTLADFADVDAAVASAHRALTDWSARGVEGRRLVLRSAAELMERERIDTIGCLVLDGGKTVAEADPEISEAIDFARYYASSAAQLAADTDGLTASPLGVVVVAPPWNFPYAIPAGGVLAALAAGNTVVLKPAPQTVLVAWHLADQLWRAGVPRDVLAFLPCPDDEVGRSLVTHDQVAAVILTGSGDTARMFLGWKPSLRLFAETSGKNALVVTAAADIDAAVRDLVRSAFGHAGQKCSAASLAIVEAAVYDHPAFRRQLRDAVTSLVVGSAWDPRTVVGPLVLPPSGPLLRALTTLDAGEQWLVEPRQLGANPHLWSPGVKTGVRPGGWFHTTECFGPVLGVMRAPDLTTAITWQNATGFGLTGGLHSLDSREVQQWCDTVEVGNAYVNRGITGAVVQRQPFGGWKASAIGPGAKAGGPNYLAELQHWHRASTVEADELPVALSSYAHWFGSEIAAAHDPTGLRAERNVFRYRPLPRGVLVRLGSDADVAELALVEGAASICGARLSISSAVPLAMRADATVEGEAALAARLATTGVDRVRVIGTVGEDLRRAAVAAGIALDEQPVLPHGRLELLRYVREQAVSVTAHRYGNVGAGPVPDLDRFPR